MMGLTVVYNRISHHAGRSGYDKLVDYVALRMAVHRLDHYHPPLVPQSVQTWLATRPGMEWYDNWSLALEAAVVRRTWDVTSGIYHFLYAEDSYRYLSRVRPLLRLRRSAVVCSYHQPPEVLDRVVADKRALTRIDAAIVMSNSQVPFLSTFVPADRVFVVPHGVDTDYYRPGDEARRDPRICLAVGQWLRDLETLRDVARVIARRDPSLRFKIITSEDHRELFDGLPNVQFLSGVSDPVLLEAYQTASMLVMPLKDCTANNTILEALACALPIITTDIGGIHDYVTPDCSILAPLRDVDAMVDAVLQLSDDVSRQRAMSQAARRRAMDFDWLQIADQQIAVYGKVIGDTPSYGSRS